MIEARRSGHLVCAWQGDADSVVVQNGKSLVYSTSSSGRSDWTLVAIDLKTGIPRWWSTPEIGYYRHPQFDPIDIDLWGDVIVVWANESETHYVDFIDLQTGKRVGHKVFWENIPSSWW